ncbi:MAG: PIN domain-containing protein [Candidatus Pacearchaeota archaeon]
MRIILDTNFILSCIKQKIDFYGELDRLFGRYFLFIPHKVIEELESISKRKTATLSERSNSKLAIDLINTHLAYILKLDGENTDSSIANYLNKSKEEIYLATLDRNLKKRITNSKVKFLTIRNKNHIEVSY